MNITDLSYKAAVDSLTDLITQNKSGIDDFKLKLYFDWITSKTEYLQKENQAITIPDTQLPQTLSIQTYNYLKPKLKKIVNSTYKKINDKYVRNTSRISVAASTELFTTLYLSKRNVVWVDFGFNVGNEFGGRHPAVILKNLGEVLIVAPISTNSNGVEESDTIITFLPNELYRMPSLRHRFTNITRITPVSLIRVDLNSNIGSMKATK